MDTRKIADAEALDLIGRGESHFWDYESSMSRGKVIQKIGCAPDSADGGEFLVGVGRSIFMPIIAPGGADNLVRIGLRIKAPN